MKTGNTLCGHNAELLNAVAGGTVVSQYIKC